MALTKDTYRSTSQESYVVTLYSKTAGTIYKGTILTFGADGDVKKSSAANEKFAGFADEQTVSGSTLTAVPVRRGGRVWLPLAGASNASVGKLAVSDADDTIAASSAAAPAKTIVGRILGFDTTGGRSQVYVDTEDKG